MTIYPAALDTDLELPRVESNVSEISGDYINSLRDAIIAIQKTIGVQPQGNKPSLTDRINVSIDANGYIKKSALDNIGLVTLPIVDRHVGASAGIQESKLALAYNTAFLFGRLTSLGLDFDATRDSLAALVNMFDMHVTGQIPFHDGYQIKINNIGDPQIGVEGLVAVTVGDAINEICARLFSHVNLGLPSGFLHTADSVLVDTSAFGLIDKNATSMQDALNSLDSSSGILGTTHDSEFHSNGLFNEIKSDGLYNPNKLVVGPSNIAYSVDSSIVQFTSLVSFSGLGLQPGDILNIPEAAGLLDYGSYQIRAVGPLANAETLGNLPALTANQIAVFHIFAESKSSVSASIYKPATVSSEYCSMACSVRNNESIVDTISVLNPSSARVVSIGFNSTILNSDGYSIGVTVGIGDGYYRSVVVPNLNWKRLTGIQASPVDAVSVAERINAYVSDATIAEHFPITAYPVGNELAIAHNWVGPAYTLEIADGYSGNFALGLDAYGANVAGFIATGNEAKSHAVDGITSNSIKTIFDGYCTLTANSQTLTLKLNNVAIDPARYGITSGSVLHISGHPIADVNGSYTILFTSASSVTLFETIPASSPTTFAVRITAADIPLTILDNVDVSKGLAQIYVDSAGNTMLHQRIIYNYDSHYGIEIIGLSNDFPAGPYNLYCQSSGGNFVFYVSENYVYGETVTVDNTFLGSFKLYHPNGLDYLHVQIVGPVVAYAIDIDVAAPLNANDALLLCSAHFNGDLKITHITDERLFGTLGAKQLRDDVLDIFSQRPTAELRSNGVVHGFDVLNMPYVDITTNMPALPLRGGIAYVNGVRVAVDTQKVLIPAYDPDGNLIVSANMIISINEFGSLQAVDENLSEMLIDGYDSDATFGKLLPLYYVTIDSGGISSFIDIRKYINNLDDKIELIVDETNNIVGNFKTLDGALLYASKYPNQEKLTIRIVNSVHPSTPLIVPNGVSILGSSIYGGNSKHQIVNTAITGSDFITLYGNNRLENVEIVSENSSLSAALVRVNGPNVNIEKCKFSFGESVDTYESDIAIIVDLAAAFTVRIVDNIINNVYSGIVAEFGVDELLIRGNKLSNVVGTNSGIAYGIQVGTSNSAINTVSICDNEIFVPSTANSDIRGISFDTGFDIDVLKITGNNIISASQDTMTRGISVQTLDGYSGMIDQLMMNDNFVSGIKLNDNNVYGIYIEDTNRIVLRGNTLEYIGVSTNSDVVAIKIASTFGVVDIDGNILQNCDLTRGIEINVQQADSRVVIANNTLVGLGANAEYIRGATSHSSIINNTLVGPGLTGIRWNGDNSKISGNSLSMPNSLLSTYAFSNCAIYAPTSDVDITDNTITGMYTSGSIGISNGGIGKDRAKIIGNTVSGSLMLKLIELYGTGHVVNSNKLYNTATYSTAYIWLNAVTNSLLMGNFMYGVGTKGITSNTSTDAISSLTIVNNSVEASVVTNSIDLGTIAASCFILGNKFSSGASPNVVGATPSYGAYNSNTMGINYGMADTISINAPAGMSACDSSGTGNAFHHWAIIDTNNYWQVNDLTTTSAKSLYFPIVGPPNGAKLTAVYVQGKMSGEGILDAQIWKRSVNGSGTYSISADVVIGNVGEFNNTTNAILVPVTYPPGYEILNYAESAYYIKITHTIPSPPITAPNNIRIYGITIEFTY